MASVDSKIRAFLELVKAGLWGEGNPEIRIAGTTDWQEVYRLATEQSVLGLVLAGLEHSDEKPPQVMLLQWIGEVQVIEQRNKAMNAFIAKLIKDLRKADVYALLVKGQGVAQCYEKPLWRACGDVDLMLSDNNYQKAFNFLRPLASNIEKEREYTRHLAMTIDGWDVELHGTLRSGLWRRLEREIDEVQKTVFYGGNVRSWVNGGTQVFLPWVNEDVFFVFTHILQHFFKGGIGLRQICDWCRLLYTFKDSLNYGLLESRIRRSGLMSEWRAFSALAVEYLGMPVEAMPLYSTDTRWKRKAERIMDYVLETGNFGHNRDVSYQKRLTPVVRKFITMWRQSIDNARHLLIFPLDSVKTWWSIFVAGLRDALNGR